MAFEQKPIILKEVPVFETVLDTACERLWEKQVEYSIRRITEMEDELTRLEAELDKFIGSAHE